MGYKHELLTRMARIAPQWWARHLRNPIFVIGTARSGTTLLANLIGQHPQIANYSEANVIWDPTGHPTPPGVAPDWVDPYVYNERWWRESQDRLAEIPAVFAVVQTLLMKPIFLNKSPYNTFRIPHILQMMPQARFIHIVRHGLAVVSSRLRKGSGFVKGMPYMYDGDDTVYDFDTAALRFARLWRLSVDEVAQQDTAHQLTERGLIHHLTYEALCDQPEHTLAAIQQFMGLKTPITLTQQPESRNDKWRDYLAPALVARLVEEMEPAFSARGYAFD